MNKKCIFLVIAILLSFGVYFLLFHKDKSLKYIPENADVVILIDTKNLTRQYISNFLTHPSKWFDDKKSDGKISFSDSGLEIPDFLEIFHLKNTNFSEWYTVLEIKDKAQFLQFLKNRKLVEYGNENFKNDQFFVKVDGEKCFIGTSDLNFKNIGKPLSQLFRNKKLNADSFVTDGVGSISFISELRTQNFSIFINDDEIEIKNEGNDSDFSSLIEDLNKKVQFLNAELDQENFDKISTLFNKNFKDSISVNRLKMKAELSEVNDTIISYVYDDNFNEVEKISYQKIVQPAYEIQFQTSNPDKIWNYFQNKIWINEQNQFTAIPFQPNLISKNEKQISIKSTKRSLKLDENKEQNYIFVKNNPLAYSSLKTLSELDKKLLQNIKYVFYGNRNLDYILKIKFKKNKYPLILR